MSFWVYMLCCADKSYYTGHTDNLEKRLAQHQSGEIEGYTSTRLPVKLFFFEQFSTRDEALRSERQIIGWGRKKKEALMKGNWNEVSRLAHRRYRSERS
jgi:predicted GIY-YIG superfamily endonuclease